MCCALGSHRTRSAATATALWCCCHNHRTVALLPQPPRRRAALPKPWCSLLTGSGGAGWNQPPRRNTLYCDSICCGQQRSHRRKAGGMQSCGPSKASNPVHDPTVSGNPRKERLSPVYTRTPARSEEAHCTTKHRQNTCRNNPAEVASLQYKTVVMKYIAPEMRRGTGDSRPYDSQVRQPAGSRKQRGIYGN